MTETREDKPPIPDSLVGVEPPDAPNTVVEFGDFTIVPKLRFMTSGVRWAAVALGAGISLIRGPGDPVPWACAISLVAFSLWQTLQPPDLERLGPGVNTAVGLELGLAGAVTLLTGGLESPYVLTSMVPLMLAGYAWASRRILLLAYVGLAIVGLLGLLRRASPESSRSGVLLGIVLLLCGVLGAFTRRLIEESAARHTATLDQMTRMTRANDMLVSLHGLAQTLPSSLDLTEVTESLRLRLRETFQYGALLVVVRDELTSSWRTAVADGFRAPDTYSDAQLVPALASLAHQPATVVHKDHLIAATTSVAPMSRSGLYTTLSARDRVVGLIAIEHKDPARYHESDRELLASIAGSVALSLDNARWFSRLRLFGAESERARIARDLHDRIAQSLAYIAFELERLAESKNPPSQRELRDVRDVLRGVVTELRDTLYELRAAVSTAEDFVGVAGRYLERYERRTGLEVRFHHEVDRRPAIAVEQELWRIVQEALENAARHARAHRLSVNYSVQNGHIEVGVVDDGRGFERRTHAADHYGLVGMGERADAIGAVLHIDSRPGRGTAVRVTLEVVQ